MKLTAKQKKLNKVRQALNRTKLEAQLTLIDDEAVRTIGNMANRAAEALRKHIHRGSSWIRLVDLLDKIDGSAEEILMSLEEVAQEIDEIMDYNGTVEFMQPASCSA